MGVVGAALRGFGRALKSRRTGLKPSGTGAIRSVKPGVGGLKASRAMKDQLDKSTAIGVEKFGRPHTTKVLSGLKGKKSYGSIVKAAGDLERTKKAIVKKHPEAKKRLGFKKGGKPWGSGPKPGTLEFYQHHTQTPKRTKKFGGGHVNTSRENRLEELGRVDAEKAHTSKGKRNLKEEKRRIVKELK